MREWASKRLRCLACEQVSLDLKRGAVGCPTCGAKYPIQNDVADFLVQPNPVVAREREAVARLDSDGAGAADRLRDLLKAMDAGKQKESDLIEFPCLKHARDCQNQIEEVLKKHPLTAGDVVAELGADHCWTSNLLLDAGCRVIAVDITDHLLLASRGSDPNLCRIHADMNRLPLAKGSVDVVWATSAAHHSWDLERTFKEAARVLRKGGRLAFCCEPLPSWLRYPFGMDFGHEEKIHGINETWIPRRRWIRLCAGAGLSPQVEFPSLGRDAIRARLERRHLPAALAPLAGAFLRSLQVSVHLLATKV